MTDILRVRDLTVRFGPIHAVRGITLSLAAGSATALIGTNGAGKSSTLLALGGALPSSAQVGGAIERPTQVDISIVPERDKIFALLSVTENMIAADRQRGQGKVRIDDVYGWFPRLAERRRSLAGNLSGGEQQMLAIGMALLGSPSVLLLDEPTLGLAVPIIERICEMLVKLRRELHLTLLVAEAEVNWLPELADDALILVRGSIVDVLRGDLRARKDEVRNVMLGLGADAPAARAPA